MSDDDFRPDNDFDEDGDENDSSNNDIRMSLARLLSGMNDGDQTGASANHYHNMACDAARMRNLRKAVQICQDGLAKHPNDIDLMADLIKYSSDLGERDIAHEQFERLSAAIPRSRWNWRAFTFSFDYLVMEPVANETICRELVHDYREYLPHEEKGVMAESEMEEAMGNHQRSIDVLVDALKNMPNCPQCALRLADKQLERGQYAEVVKTTWYGLTASAESQPSINIPYLCFLKTLAEDALLHRKTAEEGAAPVAEAKRIIHDYRRMLELFEHQLSSYTDTIETRVKLLRMLLGDNND